MLSDEEVKGTGFTRFAVKDRLGRIVTAYLSNGDTDTELPIILYCQGSGVHPLFWKKQDNIFCQYQKILMNQVNCRARVVCVEKLGIEFGKQLPSDGTASTATASFLLEHTAERWSEALYSVLQHVRNCFPSSNKVMVAGHSEGALMASLLASIPTAGISHIGLLAGSGPTQLFDFLLGYSLDTEEVIATFLYIQNQDTDPDTLIWGHPVRRWRSFLSISTLEEVLKSDALVFCAHGTEDRKVPFASALVLVAELMRNKRSVTFLPIKGGDHSFCTTSTNKESSMQAVFQKLTDWFLE